MNDVSIIEPEKLEYLPARAAAWDAAGDALKPTIEWLQTSALDLFERMVAINQGDE